MDHNEIQQNTVEHNGTQWDTTEYNGTQWNTTEHNGTLLNNKKELLRHTTNQSQNNYTDGRKVGNKEYTHCMIPFIQSFRKCILRSSCREQMPADTRRWGEARRSVYWGIRGDQGVRNKSGISIVVMVSWVHICQNLTTLYTSVCCILFIIAP